MTSDIYVLDGMTKIIENSVGIIYSVSPTTRAMVHKIGNYSKIKEVWDKRQAQYTGMEKILENMGEQYHFLQLPTTPEVSKLHYSNRFENFILENNIHPIRTERLQFGQ